MDLNREHLLGVEEFQQQWESLETSRQRPIICSGNSNISWPMVCPLRVPLFTVLAWSSRSLSTQLRLSDRSASRASVSPPVVGRPRADTHRSAQIAAGRERFGSRNSLLPGWDCRVMAPARHQR